MFTEMSDIGPQLSESDINDLELKLKVTLPFEYRDFLLKYNGGEPKEDTINFDGKKININGVSIGFFYGIGNGSEDIEVAMDLIADYIPNGFIPIADTPAGNYFLISTVEDFYGHIYYKDCEIEDDSNTIFKGLLPKSMVEVSSSFREFLSCLYE